jgi:iron(III) transport system ATP-binding protein
LTRPGWFATAAAFATDNHLQSSSPAINTFDIATGSPASGNAAESHAAESHAVAPASADAPFSPPEEQLRLCGLWHRYPGAAVGEAALRGIDLALRSGELVGLLGPSGCGKTTLLRLIAGFERPWQGSVWIDGREVAGPSRWLPPERRGVGMVFQDYALFPHLDAWSNVCFGLRPGQDRSRADWLLELLGLDAFRRRYPHELSGGQRQRLALARALAPGPRLVLLDEPFSNLDVEVRLHLRAELPGVLAECGAGGLMVTHDPEEALAICDRVAVLSAGELHQCATPRDLVREPSSSFVGRFLLQANVLPARIDARQLVSALGSLPLPPAAIPASSGLELLIRPESLEIEPDPAGPAVVVSREFLGREWLVQVQCRDQRLRLRLPLERNHARGERCQLRLRAGEHALLFPGAVPITTAASSPPGGSPSGRSPAERKVF